MRRLTCASCGHVAKENRKSQAAFECVACGYTNNADINAAQNLLLRAFNPEQKIAVAPRRQSERSHQGASCPASLPTEPVAALAQEADQQGVLISTAATQTVTAKRVKHIKQLDLLLQAAA